MREIPCFQRISWKASESWGFIEDICFFWLLVEDINGSLWRWQVWTSLLYSWAVSPLSFILWTQIQLTILTVYYYHPSILAIAHCHKGLGLPSEWLWSWKSGYSEGRSGEQWRTTGVSIVCTLLGVIAGGLISLAPAAGRHAFFYAGDIRL